MGNEYNTIAERGGDPREGVADLIGFNRERDLHCITEAVLLEEAELRASARH
jgi:hypothetical protein